MNLRVTCGHNQHETIGKYNDKTISGNWHCKHCGIGLIMNPCTTIRVREMLSRHLELAPHNVVSINTLQRLMRTPK